MLSKIRLYLYVIGAASWAGLMAWAYTQGRKNEQGKHTRRRVDAMKDAKETRHEVQNSDDQRLVDILAGRVRDGKR
jgi:hypothetical protein